MTTITAKLFSTCLDERLDVQVGKGFQFDRRATFSAITLENANMNLFSEARLIDT